MHSNHASEQTQRWNGEGLEPIAIVGMAGRFPMAKDVREFWTRLYNGEHCISRFTPQQLQTEGVDPSVFENPNYVAAAPVLEDVEQFDAAFFGITPREAELMDPQHRIFLECCWEALEDAGYDPKNSGEGMGLFAGARTDTYLFNILTHPDLVAAVGAFHLGLGNDLAFLSTRVSHFLNLTGPSVSVHTACSTSLVAVHLACDTLRQHRCEAALAGGIAVNVPHSVGYMYEEGSVQSPDGYCRTFDASARGTVFGSGAGVVLLKRLDDALANKDSIYALIRGSAINNDGSDKASFTAPSVQGQVAVIRDALRLSGVAPDSIGYVECHGTGTLLGDAIELRALTKSFGKGAPASCAIGSVKTNVGHLDAAAGMTGLIKTALSLKYRVIPASLHYVRPNPQIRFEGTRFYVNTSTTPWIRKNEPLRAGVSAFGVGGTNAHVILEEPPAHAVSESMETLQVLPLSARSEDALDKAYAQLRDHLRIHPELELGDVAFTLQEGRHHFSIRGAIVAGTREDAIAALEKKPLAKFTYSDDFDLIPPSVTFLFPGQGAQYAGMGKSLYDTEPVFRNAVRECSDILRPLLNIELEDVLFPVIEDGAKNALLDETFFTQPALLSIEFALARLLMSWGVQPESMLGHSLGEYAAAVLAEVMTIGEALHLVVIRGQLMQASGAGGMLAVSRPVGEITALLGEDLAVAAVNAPDLCTIAGPLSAIIRFESELRSNGIAYQSLRTSRAFHCALVEPAMPPFLEEVRKVRLQPPRIPFVSGVTGTWIRPEEAQDPEYWCRQMRLPVQFDAAMAELGSDNRRILLDVGPGQTLRRLALRQARSRRTTPIYAAMPATPTQDERESGLKALAQLWEVGVPILWSATRHDAPRRVNLPTYPYERSRYWIDPQVTSSRSKSIEELEANELQPSKIAEVERWFWIPSWRQMPLTAAAARKGDVWLILMETADSFGEEVCRTLERRGCTVVRVRLGDQFSANGYEYVVDRSRADDYERLFQSMEEMDLDVNNLAYINIQERQAAGDYDAQNTSAQFEASVLEDSLNCIQSAVRHKPQDPFHMFFVTSGLASIEESDRLSPEKSSILALGNVLLDEHESFRVKIIDVLPRLEVAQAEQLAVRLANEMQSNTGERLIAYRNRFRWVLQYENVPLEKVTRGDNELQDRDSYLIVGGLGNVGLLIADHLVRTRNANLVLMTRRRVPERPTWPNILQLQPETRLAQGIRSILSLEAMGAKVETIEGDITVPAEASHAVDFSQRRFGNLTGIIHAAGVTGGPTAFCPIPKLTIEAFAIQEHAKLVGLQVLEEAIRGREIPLVLCISSNSSIVGGYGFAAYASGSCAMNAFVAEKARSSEETRWVSTSWDHWPEAQAAGSLEELEDVYGDVDEDILLRALDLKHRFAMTASEAQSAVEYVLSSSIDGHIIVSTGNLPARLSQFVTSAVSSKQISGSHLALGTRTIPRPSLRNAYVPPRTDLEVALASLWREHLGVEVIGLHDDFFELGGHSLLATKLVADIRNTLKINLALVKLFERPTISQMADVIAEQARELDHAAR